MSLLETLAPDLWNFEEDWLNTFLEASRLILFKWFWRHSDSKVKAHCLYCNSVWLLSDCTRFTLIVGNEWWGRDGGTGLALHLYLWKACTSPWRCWSEVQWGQLPHVSTSERRCGCSETLDLCLHHQQWPLWVPLRAMWVSEHARKSWGS